MIILISAVNAGVTKRPRACVFARRRAFEGGMAAALFRHELQVLIALYLYSVGYIVKPPGGILECLGRLAGLEPLVMDWIGQTARDAVNGPVELV